MMGLLISGPFVCKEAMENDRRKEKRLPGTLRSGIFLSRGRDGPAATPTVWGQLLTISRHGASIALQEIMADRIHLALAPMETDTLKLNVTFSVGEKEQPLIIPARPIWFNKKMAQDIPPFRVGMEFITPLSAHQVQEIGKVQ